VPPSNKAAELATDTFAGTTTIIAPPSGGNLFGILAVVLAVAAVAALAVRHLIAKREA
jgi:hypothetical protein